MCCSELEAPDSEVRLPSSLRGGPTLSARIAVLLACVCVCVCVCVRSRHPTLRSACLSACRRVRVTGQLSGVARRSPCHRACGGGYLCQRASLSRCTCVCVCSCVRVCLHVCATGMLTSGARRRICRSPCDRRRCRCPISGTDRRKRLRCSAAHSRTSFPSPRWTCGSAPRIASGTLSLKVRVHVHVSYRHAGYRYLCTCVQRACMRALVRARSHTHMHAHRQMACTRTSMATGCFQTFSGRRSPSSCGRRSVCVLFSTLALL